MSDQELMPPPMPVKRSADQDQAINAAAQPGAETRTQQIHPAVVAVSPATRSECSEDSWQQLQELMCLV